MFLDAKTIAILVAILAVCALPATQPWILPALVLLPFLALARWVATRTAPRAGILRA